MTVRERMLKNSGSVLLESAEEKLKEIEIKERATRLIQSFQREVLSLAQFIENGGSYGPPCMGPNGEKRLDEETVKKYKAIVTTYLMSKVDGLKDMVIDAFEIEKSEEEKPEAEVTVVTAAPEMKMADPVKSLFGY